MNIRKLLLVLVLAGLIGLAGWFVWRPDPLPLPPELSLDHADPAVVELIENARAAVLREPRSAAAWGKLAMVLSANNFGVPALECFAQAERYDPEDPRWPYMRASAMMDSTPKEGMDLMRRALAVARSPDVQSTIHFHLARTLIEEGRLDEAADHLQALQQIEKSSARVLFCLALLARARDDRATAREHLTRLLDVPFARKKACILLANLSEQDLKQARAYEVRAAGLPDDLQWPDPILAEMQNFSVIRFGRLREVQQLNRHGQSLKALKLASQLVADLPDAHSYLVIAETLLHLNQLDEAERTFQKVIDLDPRHVSAHYFQGVVLFERARRRITDPNGQKEARELFARAVLAEDRAVAIQHDHAGAHLYRGRALQYLGRTEDAIKSLREALVCRPEESDIHLYLGEMLAEKGQFREATEALENAVRLAKPNDNRPREALKKWQARGGSNVGRSK